jgi:hypothetical protein
MINMIEENKIQQTTSSISPQLTNETKKQLQAKFTFGISDKFYGVTKNRKSRISSQLKD